MIQEVVRYERVPVPDELLVERPATEIPSPVKYGQIIQTHIADRAIIETLNGQIRAIRALNNEDDQ